MDPVRLLESHMACLRHSYDSWMFNEPEIESDRPTDEEMEAYEEAEQQHKDQFLALGHQAARLSQSLGVGRLSDPKLSPALLGFIREGIRFSFSNRDMGSDDQDLVLGCRLSFLSILGKYVNWIRRNRAQKETIGSDLDDREYTLRTHEDFSEVHQDDLNALASFRELLGFKLLSDSIPVTPVTADNDSIMPQSVAESSMPEESLIDDDSNATPEESVSRSRRSIASVLTDLSPVREATESSSSQHSSSRDSRPHEDVSRASTKRSLSDEDDSHYTSRASTRRSAPDDDDSHYMSRASTKRTVPDEDDSHYTSRASTRRSVSDEDDSHYTSRASTKRSVSDEDDSHYMSRASTKRTVPDEDDSRYMSRASSRRSADVNLTQSTYLAGKSQTTYGKSQLTQTSYAGTRTGSSIESEMSSPESSVPLARPKRKRRR